MTYRLIINNCIEEIAKLNPFVEKVSEGFCIARDTLFKLQLALDEALSNSVKYAYPQGTCGTVTLEAEKINRSLIFRLIDEGMAFDPTKRKDNIDLTSKAEERPVTLGRSDAEYIEITAGLTEDDVVLVPAQPAVTEFS